MKQLRSLLRPKVVLSGLFAAVIVALGLGLAAQQTVSASACPGRDDDDNAIIRCGYGNLGTGSDGFAAKYALQNSKTNDLAAVYAKFHFTSVSDFSQHAQHVTVYKNGQIKLDNGTVIATDAMSLGRQKFNSARQPMVINGKTYYYSATKDSFGVDSLGGYALINDDHSMSLAILNACGNPSWGNSPGYKCKMLNQTKVNDTTYTYSISTPVATNGATVTKVVIDYGDGQSKTITSNFTQTVTHVYAPGDYTARATVYFSANGSTVSDTRADCTKKVHVPQPPKPTFVCTPLIVKKDSRTQFTFTETPKVTNGAKLLSATFKFDDGTTAPATAVNGTVSLTHTFSATGDHTTKVDLTFNDGTDNNNPACVAQITVTPPTCADTPNKPECLPCPYNPNISKASHDCVKPCEFNNNIPSTSPDCKKPTCETDNTLPGCQKTPPTCETDSTLPGCKPLPSTGAEDTIGTVLGLSSVTGAGAYWHASRRNLLSRFFKR